MFVFLMVWKRIKKWLKDNQEKGSDEYIEREELKKSLNESSKDLTTIMNAGFHNYGENALKTAVLIQNLHLQKKLSQATDGLKNATWILALATGIFAWVGIEESSNPSYFISTLQGIASIIIFFVIIFIALNLIWIFIKFIVKSITSFRNKK